MAHREFADSDGVVWEMWEVHPTLADRRRSADPRPPSDVPERRKRRNSRPTFARMRSGWLAMQSATERRRVMPVPEDWASRTDDELREILRSAVNTGKRRRLIE